MYLEFKTIYLCIFFSLFLRHYTILFLPCNSRPQGLTSSLPRPTTAPSGLTSLLQVFLSLRYHIQDSLCIAHTTTRLSPLFTFTNEIKYQKLPLTVTSFVNHCIGCSVSQWFVAKVVSTWPYTLSCFLFAFVKLEITRYA